MANARQFMGARTAAWSGKPPQYDAKVEYLESQDVQYIDSGIELSKDIGYVLNFDFDLFCSTYSSNRRLMAFWGDDDLYWSSGLVYRVNSFTAIWGSVSQFAFPKPSPTLSNSFLSVNFLNDGHLSLDSSDLELPARTDIQPSIVRNLTVFGWWNGKSPIIVHDRDTWAKIRVFGFKVSKGSDVVRDMIPVRRDGVGYMYDRISGQLFGNQGTGKFIIGPDKTT